MTTIKITARDSSTAMEEVSKKLGADAYILSTSSTDGGVEIEATNDPVELKKFSNKPKKKFSNLMQNQLGNITTFPTPRPKPNDKFGHPATHHSAIASKRADTDLSLLTKSITKLTDDIRGMYITGSGGLGVEIGESTFLKLEQVGFQTSVIKALSPSFNGLNFERGRSAFMNALAKTLTATDVESKLRRVSFVNGLSGVGKTTLVAKLSASQRSSSNENITLATLGDKADPIDDSLRSYGRMLNMPVLRLNPDTLMESLCSTKGKIIVDVSIDPGEGINAILNAGDFLADNEVTSIVAIPSGSSSAFIRRQAKLYQDLNYELTLTKLDECDLTSTEISEFFLNSMKIHYLTGSKSISGELSACNTEILTQYLIENC